jgi:hypothetical protein
MGARHVVLLTPSKSSCLTQLLSCKQTAPLTPFRINTCKSVTKQKTLTIFGMNTYKKIGGGGYESTEAKEVRRERIARA